MANITPVHEKDWTQKVKKNNYRHVNIFLNISNVYERIMFKQLSEHFEN